MAIPEMEALAVAAEEVLLETLGLTELLLLELVGTTVAEEVGATEEVLDEREQVCLPFLQWQQAFFVVGVGWMVTGVLRRASEAVGT